MRKKCFTCAHKISRELSKDERKELYRQNPTGFVGEMEFTCGISGEKIRQIDPACEHYSGDIIMESIRKDIAKTARKLREELNG